MSKSQLVLVDDQGVAVLAFEHWCSFAAVAVVDKQNVVGRIEEKIISLKIVGIQDTALGVNVAHQMIYRNTHIVMEQMFLC